MSLDTNLLIDAADRHAANYEDDTRDCIQTDVINAFHQGAAFAEEQLAVEIKELNTAVAARAFVEQALKDTISALQDERDRERKLNESLTEAYEKVNFELGRAVAELGKLKAEREQMEKQEPVAVVDDEGTIVVCSYHYKKGDKLYAHPPVPDGKVLVDAELLGNILKVCEIYSCAPRWENIRNLVSAQHEMNLRVRAFAELGKAVKAAQQGE